MRYHRTIAQNRLISLLQANNNRAEKAGSGARIPVVSACFASYGTGDLDDGFGNSVDIDELSACVGYHMPLSGKVDLVTGLSYEYVDLSAPGLGSVDDNGFGLSIGLRFAATEQVELNAGIKYIDLSDSGDDTGFGIGGLYNFTENFSVGLSGSWTDDTSTYGIGGRFNFGH